MRAAFALSVGLLSGSVLGQGLEARLREAERLVAQKQLDSALALLGRAIADHPRDHRPLEIRAAARSRSGDLDGAIADAAAALVLAADSWRAHFERGFALFHKRRLREALADYDRAAELAPRVAAIHGERGDLLRELDEPAAAVVAYDLALRLAPGWTEAYSGRGLARAALGDFAPALADLRRASRADPGVRGALASVAIEAGEDDVARRALVDWPPPPGSRVAVCDFSARLMWRIGDRAAALASLEDGYAGALEEPRLAELDLTRACLQFGGGALTEAQARLEATRANAPADLVPYFDLMLWCCRARLQGQEMAGAQLPDATAGVTPDPRLQRFVALCLGRDPTADSPVPREAPSESCPADFFAGWRAHCAGDAPAARRLLMRSVASGALEWLQWYVALDCLRALPDGAKLRPGLGVVLEFGVREGREVAVVKTVVPDSAAALQGLVVGDEIVALFRTPITVERWHANEARARVGSGVSLTVRRDGHESVRYLRFGLSD